MHEHYWIQDRVVRVAVFDHFKIVMAGGSFITEAMLFIPLPPHGSFMKCAASSDICDIPFALRRRGQSRPLTAPGLMPKSICSSIIELCSSIIELFDEALLLINHSIPKKKYKRAP